MNAVQSNRHSALRVASLLRSCVDTPGKVILAISGAVAFSIFLVTDPFYFSGDLNSYLNYAIAMAHFTVSPATFYRQAGYPFLIDATLYPWTRSLLGLLAVQAIFAALIPWIIYRILLYVSMPLAIVGALLSLVTLLPNLFQTLLMPDQTQLFLNILFCYALIKYWFESTTGNMVGMFLVYACISFLRPPFLLLYLFFPLIVGASAWINRKERPYRYVLKPFVALSISVACLNLSASALNAHLYARAHSERGSIDGSMLLINPFIQSTGVDGAFADGVYTNILRNKLIDFLRNAPAEQTDIRILRPQIADRFIQYQSDPERMVDALMNERTLNTWTVLFYLSLHFGKSGDSLLMKVALEQYRLHPKVLWNVIKAGFLYYLGVNACVAPPYGLAGNFVCQIYLQTSPSQDYMILPNYEGPYTGMGIYTSRLFGESFLAEVEAPFLYYARVIWPWVYRIMLPLAALFTGAGIAAIVFRIFWRGQLRKLRQELPVLLALLGVYLIYVGPMMILADAEFRYVSAGALFLLTSGLLSIWILAVGPALPTERVEASGESAARPSRQSR